MFSRPHSQNLLLTILLSILTSSAKWPFFSFDLKSAFLRMEPRMTSKFRYRQQLPVCSGLKSSLQAPSDLNLLLQAFFLVTPERLCGLLHNYARNLVTQEGKTKVGGISFAPLNVVSEPSLLHACNTCTSPSNAWGLDPEVRTAVRYVEDESHCPHCAQSFLCDKSNPP